MHRKSLWNSISLFETGLSAAEWGWRIFTLLFIGGSGAISAFIAKADPLLKELGAIYWIGVGVIFSLAASFILYLIKSAILKQVTADYQRTLSFPRNTINPLAENFKDVIIPVEDLRLPLLQLHQNKHFKRCKFVGPAAIALTGGIYRHTNFTACGDIIALSGDIKVVGIIALRDCTVEECEFINITIFVDQASAKSFAEAGGSVKGMIK